MVSHTSLASNIKLGLKSLIAKNALAYYFNMVLINAASKGFIVLALNIFLKYFWPHSEGNLLKPFLCILPFEAKS